jgi:nucleoside-diphosphate-sugar epimerase
MDVLVIGGTRFLGRLLTWRLLAAGHRVTLLNRGRLPDPFGERVARLRIDRTTPAFAAAVADRRFDATVDLAAYTGADARGVVDALGERAGHYVLISTGQVYLVRPGCPRPAREEDYDGVVMARPEAAEDVPEWEYGVGKRAAEDVLVAAAASGFRATRLRIPMVNGPGDYYRRIDAYLWRLTDGGPLIVPDGGAHQVRHVYVDDVARAIVGLLGHARTFGQAYNLAQDETPTLRELLEQLASIAGARAQLVDVPAATLRARGFDPVRLSAFSGRWMSFLEPARAKADLGFRATPLATQLAQIVAAFYAHGAAEPPEGYTATRAAEVVLARASR